MYTTTEGNTLWSCTRQRKGVVHPYTITSTSTYDIIYRRQRVVVYIYTRQRKGIHYVYVHDNGRELSCTSIYDNVYMYIRQHLQTTTSCRVHLHTTTDGNTLCRCTQQRKGVAMYMYIRHHLQTTTSCRVHLHTTTQGRTVASSTTFLRHEKNPQK